MIAWCRATGNAQKMRVNLTFALPAAQSTPTVLTSSWRWIHLTWTTFPALHWWVINISEWSFESIYRSLCASAWSVHFFGFPQMWACALGHTEAALVLYQWDPRALAIPDSLGRLPLNIARSRGHTRLAELLEQLQQTPQAPGQPSDNWMDRWRGESQTSGINSSPTPNHRNSGGKQISDGSAPGNAFPKADSLVHQNV